MSKLFLDILDLECEGVCVHMLGQSKATLNRQVICEDIQIANILGVVLRWECLNNC